MVLPTHHRQGIGRMLTEKLNAVADAWRAPTYVRARPGAAALFVQMGYETLERIDFDLKDFGVDLRSLGFESKELETRTAVFAMRRMPGAKDERGAKLDWS